MIWKVARFFRPGLFPFILGFLFLGFSVTYYALDFPDPIEIQKFLRTAFERYGFAAVFLATLLESLFVLSFYFPGSLVIVLSVLAIGGSLGNLSQLTIVVACGAFVGISADYAIGRYGLYSLFARIGGREGLERAASWQERWGVWSFLLFGFHPNFLALVATHAGIAGVKYLRVALLTIISLLFWTPLAIFLISVVVSEVSATSTSQHWYVFGAFMVWGLLLAGLNWLQSESPR
ncbi:DedA family protein [Roseovarius sp. 2305UL8-3]|uniref:DedA family protein n=1 Tax=Roseovarius conchicola TaxID=3121636 RepID=UPI003527944C